LNRFIWRSRRRVGWCEFSARLLSPLCWRCSGLPATPSGRYPWHDLLPGRPVRFQLVGDHDSRCSAVLFQELAQQPLGRLLVAPALGQNIEHDAVPIHGAPKVMLPAGNLENDLIHMPRVARLRQPPAASSRERGRCAEALSFDRSSRRRGRSVPIGHCLGPEGAQGSAGNQMALEVEPGSADREPAP
jgi:hypothetical protein